MAEFRVKLRTGPVVRVTVLVLIAAACAQNTVVAGGTGTDSALPPPDATLESMDAVVDDFGDGWELVDSWFSEGPEVEWTTGCEPFDRLDVFARSGPWTGRWRSGSADMVHRVQSLEDTAPQYAAEAARIAEVCPTIVVDGQWVALTAIDADAVFGHEGEDITVSAVGYDSFPVASPESDSVIPVFEPDRPAWQITLTRPTTRSRR